MSEEQNTGQFSKVIVTTVGKEMIAKSQNGQTLTFTRVALGDGLIANEDDPINFIKIKNERLSAPIAKYTDRGNGQFELQFRVSNKEVETGFWHREIGVMAKIDEGPEQLYAYTTAGNKASFLYDKTTPIEERIVNIAFVIGNAQNVQVIVNSSIIYVTLEDMEEALDTHNTSSDSHTEAFEKHNDNEDSHTPAFTKHNNDENAHENLVNMLKEIIENSGINILKRKKSYNVGDIAYSTKITSTTHLASKLYLECIQAGTTGIEEPILTNINLNDEITDGTAKFKVYDVGLQSLPVGSIYQSTIATGPEELFGGTWEAMPAGRVLLAQGNVETENYTHNFVAGETGGEFVHQLTVGE
uniref:phage baseplate protein n=1 Tax=Megamonas sp. TaxID=2049033 RepID=UPI002586076B